MSPLLSICIPTYNGAHTLRRTVENIVNQLGPEAASRTELLLCDDCSTDSTLELARELAKGNPSIRLHANPKNLGMDGNFRQSALLAKGKYVWFSGQDDVFCEGILAKVLAVLEGRPELGFIYINYSQVGHDMSEVLIRSYLKEELNAGQTLEEENDFFFPGPKQFFTIFNSAPTFLPATVIRRDFWLDTDVSSYEGTAFIQTALILLNMTRAPIYVITKPSILGRIPNDQWQSKGQSLFRIFLGHMAMEAQVFQDSRNPTPASIYETKKRSFLINFFPLVRSCKKKGMKPTPEFKRQLKIIYGKNPGAWLYTRLMLALPGAALDCLSQASKPFRGEQKNKAN